MDIMVDITEENAKEGNETLLVFGAHNDDHIIGMGGTISKYKKEGKKVAVRIFSYGELSHPHLKEKVIISMRVKESRLADKILGLKDVKYLGVKESKFSEFIKKDSTKEKIKEIIVSTRPTKIFTHSPDDPHPAHSSLNSLIMSAVSELNLNIPIYSFDVWNVVKTKRNLPKLIVDITEDFDAKIKALKAHESQQMTIVSLSWRIYLKDRLNGWKNKCRYAEVFYKIM
jgi:LmbE family N-acetylglucosaminyl deacetylase